MIFAIEEKIELWECVAAAGLIRAIDKNASIECDSKVGEVMEAAGIQLSEVCRHQGPAKYLQFFGAYRAIDSSSLPYIDVLASQNSFSYKGGGKIPSPVFQTCHGSVMSGIVIAPHGLRSDLNMPLGLWQQVIRYLRSYGVPLYYMGEPGERLDRGLFYESEIFSERPFCTKLDLLESAQLIIGVPNAWSWAAAGWEKHMIILYPDTVPQQRWFWFHSPNFVKVVYDAHHIQVPTILRALTSVIAGI